MKIAVDAMGGDKAPEEIVSGALQAAEKYKVDILLVGDAGEIQNCCGSLPGRVEVVPASEVIEMGERPAAALRKKKDASIAVATQLAKDGKADAVVSAGSTGAQMAAALILLGRIPGVQRPAIATVLPGASGPKLLLDVGANTDCRPHNLVEFAIMGSAYAESVLGISSPLVGLLNIGTEPSKGNELTRQAFSLLEKAGINFYGNIEPRDIPIAETSVIVCDGFVGNAMIKFGEGLAKLFYDRLRSAVKKSLLTQFGGILMLSGLKEMGRQLDWQEYGGAPLLGVNGVSVVCHGSSEAKAVKNAVGVAVRCVENGFVQKVYDSIRMEEKVGACQWE